MGPGLIAWIVLLAGQFHLSIRQAQGKANPWLGVLYRQIGAEVRERAVAHADETRHFRRIGERPLTAGAVGRRLLLLAQGVICTRHRWPDDPTPTPRWQRRLRRLRRSFQATLECGAALTNTRTANPCRHLLRDEALCWTFLKDPRIPLTNNHAERAIRP